MKKIRHFFNKTIQRRRAEQDLNAELHASLDLLTQQYIQSGMSESKANACRPPRIRQLRSP